MDNQQVDKNIINDIINYFTINNILGITYVEPIDADSAFQLNITVTNDAIDGDKNVPSKKITAIDSTPQDITFLKKVLYYLQTQQIRSFKYDMPLPMMEQTLHIKVDTRKLIPTIEE